MDERMGEMNKDTAFPTVKENYPYADLDMLRIEGKVISQTMALRAGQAEKEEESTFAEGLPEWDILPPYSERRRQAKYDSSATRIFGMD